MVTCWNVELESREVVANCHFAVTRMVLIEFPLDLLHGVTGLHQIKRFQLYIKKADKTVYADTNWNQDPYFQATLLRASIGPGTLKRCRNDSGQDATLTNTCQMIKT